MPAAGVTSTAEPVIRGRDLIVRRSGELSLLGLPAGHPELRARVRYATQDPAVYTDLTLAENLRYFGTVLGLRGKRLTEAAARTIADLGLTGLEGRVTGTFSGGQLARVGLAVALLGRPDVLVLDEPTVGLDPVLRRDLWQIGHTRLASWTLTLATAHRVLAQLRHDPRTVVMMLAVPGVLMILLRYVLDNPLALDRFAPAYIGVFPWASRCRAPRCRLIT